MLARRLLMASAGAATGVAVEDAFSTDLYTGNNSTQSITNGIDLSGKGGLVWLKSRANTYGHGLYDTSRGVGKLLKTNETTSESDLSGGSNKGLSAFNGDGFSLDADGAAATANFSGTYAAWTFRKAPNFFDVQEVSHTNGAATNVDLSNLSTIGMAVAKRTDSTGDWYVWHRSLTSGYNLRLHTTAAESNTAAYLSVSGTTLVISASMPTGTYHIQGYAHDTSDTGIIQCGSFVPDGLGSASISLGWDTQFIMLKRTSAAGNWEIFDSTRTPSFSGNDALIYANAPNPEASVARIALSGGVVTATGLAASSDYIYKAIRAEGA